jgi:hypothetical protein
VTLPNTFGQSPTSKVLHRPLYRKLVVEPDRVTGLSNVLGEVERVLCQHELTDWQAKALLPVLEECRHALVALGKVVDGHYCLRTASADGIGDKLRRAWKRLNWKQNEIQSLRSRITLHVGLLNAFNGSLTRLPPPYPRVKYLQAD